MTLVLLLDLLGASALNPGGSHALPSRLQCLAAHLDASKVRLGHLPKATPSQPDCVSQKYQSPAPSPLPQESIQAHFKEDFEMIICKLQKAETKSV